MLAEGAGTRRLKAQLPPLELRRWIRSVLDAGSLEKLCRLQRWPAERHRSQVQRCHAIVGAQQAILRNITHDMPP